MTEQVVSKAHDGARDEVEELKAQKEVLDARLALLASQRAFAEEAGPASAEAARAAAEVRAANASGALAQARLSEVKAGLGELPSSGVAGAVELKGNAGELESSLLAICAVRDASARIADEVLQSLPQGDEVVAIAAAQMPAVDLLVAHRTRVAVARAALESALPSPEEAPAKRALPGAAAAVVGMVGAGLDAAAKLASFFRADYSVTAAATTVHENLAVSEVANRLRESAVCVTAPAIYHPPASAGVEDGLARDLLELASMKRRADERSAHSRREAEIVNAEAERASEPAMRGELLEKAEHHEAVAEKLEAAGALFDACFGPLTAPAEKSSSSLLDLTAAMALMSQLTDEEAPPRHLLVLDVVKAGGGTLVRKSLWSFFGGIPLFHTGGAAIGYALLDGKTGRLEAAGVVPVHRGFVRADRLQEEVARESARSSASRALAAPAAQPRQARGAVEPRRWHFEAEPSAELAGGIYPKSATTSSDPLARVALHGSRSSSFELPPGDYRFEFNILSDAPFKLFAKGEDSSGSQWSKYDPNDPSLGDMGHSGRKIWFRVA